MIKPWEALDAERVLQAEPFVSVWRERVRTGTGRIVEDFYRVDMRPFAICVPVLADGRIVSIWQYKHGPRAHGLCFPAGYLNPGEDPRAAAERELLEETGYSAAEWVELGEFVDNGNQRACVGHYFLAKRCERVADPDSGDLEEMQVRVTDPSEIDAALAQGDMHVVHDVAAWGLARPHLRRFDR